MKEFTVWVQENLEELIGFAPGKELVDYILAFETRSEIEDGLSSLLDLNDKKNENFINTFFERWTSPKTPVETPDTKDIECAEVLIMQDEKPPIMDLKEQPVLFDEVPIMHVKPPTFNEDTPVVRKKTPQNPDRKTENKVSDGVNRSPFQEKNKFISLYSADGKVKSEIVLLPGRHWCQCMAQKHKLINNCIECGRIVCEQEGAGPCLFCNNLVCSPEDQEVISRESKSGRKLQEMLMKQTQVGNQVAYADGSLKKAIAHKDKLLHYDQQGTERTQVIDDEGDYYSVNNRWLEQQVKEELKRREAKLDEKKSRSRRDAKFTLDLIGGSVVEAEEKEEEYEDLDKMIRNSKICEQKNHSSDVKSDKNVLLNSAFDFPVLEFQYGEEKKSREVAVGTTKKHTSRVQDRELQEITDQGVCLSMHQPWASLLVRGIKKLEGRNWYTKHRGRLWIASTVKVPSKEDIEEVENQYKEIYFGQECPEFPKTYPTGALLGCVNVVDCLPYGQYCEQNPDDLEESNSDYVFVCEHATELELKLPVKGKHKIYHLEKSTLTSAKNLLRAS